MWFSLIGDFFPNLLLLSNPPSSLQKKLHSLYPPHSFYIFPLASPRPGLPKSLYHAGTASAQMEQALKSQFCSLPADSASKLWVLTLNYLRPHDCHRPSPKSSQDVCYCLWTLTAPGWQTASKLGLVLSRRRQGLSKVGVCIDEAIDLFESSF